MSAKIEGPGVVLPRLKMHRQTLNAILNDSRISGSRRMLGEFLGVWMDLYGHPETQDRMLSVIEGVWGDPKKARFTDEGEPVIQESQSNTDKEAVLQIKNIFDEALKERHANEIPAT